MADPILDDLTPAQAQAVAHRDGPLLVVAGAGSGKTRVVTRRIANLIRHGTHPRAILAMTFTNKAAGEMQRRVEALTGCAPRWIGTFHSMCARFLRYDLDALGEGRDGRFTIYDTTDQEGLMKECIKARRVDDKRFKPRRVLARISRAKCDLVAPDEFGEGGWDDEVIASLYAEYEKRLRAMNAADFDDLLVLTVKLLQKVPGLKERYHERFQYLLIDEYQDTNHTQYRLMRLLANEAGNVHVTGDPDQSIYSWRGAEYRNIMEFRKDFPEAGLVRLEQNYRSTPTILQMANELIRNNDDRIEKSLFTENADDEQPVLARLPDDRGEAAWVCERIETLRAEGYALGSMAVFYRTNAQSRPFEEALMHEGFPYQLIGGVRFYDRKEIKNILAHLKALVNPRDTVALRRMAGCRPTGVGPKTLEYLEERAAALSLSPLELLSDPDFAQIYGKRVTKKLAAFARWCRHLRSAPLAPVGICVKTVLEHSGLIPQLESEEEDERLENLESLLQRAVEFEAAHPEADLAAFLEDVALVADIDMYEPDTDRLSLMTLHSAKGLEFPVVFVVGLEEGLLPHSNARMSAEREEERRLFYVGITRAQRRLFMAHAAQRMTFGRVEPAASSRFLRELPTDLVECEDHADPLGYGMPEAEDEDEPFAELGDDIVPFHDDAPPPRLKKKEKLPLPFKAGDHVEHATFGRGKVLSASPTQAVVQFFVGGTKLLHLDMAKLKRV